MTDTETREQQAEEIYKQVRGRLAEIGKNVAHRRFILLDHITRALDMIDAGEDPDDVCADYLAACRRLVAEAAHRSDWEPGR